MINTVTDGNPATGELRGEVGVSDWRTELRADLDATIERGAGRWSNAIGAVAWIHLASFLICQALHDPALKRDPRLLLIWVGELAVVLAALRAIAGPGWMRSSPAIGVVTRLWGTFLILSFNLVMLNALLGWESRWYKPAWGTLSTFFLASLAWLFAPRLFIPAVQMYFTALLMVQFKEQENLIYGVSWWIALLGISRGIRRRETRHRGRLEIGAPRVEFEARDDPRHRAGAGSGDWENGTPRSTAVGSTSRIAVGSHTGSSQSPPPR
jgi:hypothetical protein